MSEGSRLDQRLVSGLADLMGLETFVETGTLAGDTTVWAADRFARVITIEAAEPLFARAQQRFSGCRTIKSLFGDSAACLATLLPSLKPSLFFLDAHWCGGESAGELFECPLLTELALIQPWLRRHVIIVDDARLFLRPPPPPHRAIDWPSLDEIVAVMRGSAYVVLHEDTLVLAPIAMKPAVRSLIHGLVHAQAQP